MVASIVEFKVGITIISKGYLISTWPQYDFILPKHFNIPSRLCAKSAKEATANMSVKWL